MAGEKDDGGQAFPRAEGKVSYGHDGMTLRDYFAGQAIAGMCASDAEGTWPSASMALQAYVLADAMLLERNK
jgi:hypothetical protein